MSFLTSVHAWFFGKDLRGVYSLNQPDLSKITDVKFRHFRFRMPDGAFQKVKRKIHNEGELQEELAEAGPLDVYYSTSCWLNPHLLAARSEKDVLKNILISSDLSFDIDVNEEVKDLDDARRQALALTSFLNEKKIPIRYSAFSGSKGFHVVCSDPWKKEVSHANPREREKKALEKRKELVEEARERGIKFDEKVTVDTRRIIRVPGTVNSKTGYLCRVLEDGELEGPTQEILSKTPKIRIASGIPLLREMTDYFVIAHKLWALRPFGGKAAARPYYSTFLTNNIPGTTLKIPIFEFSSKRNPARVELLLRKLQAEYGLGDIFLFDDGEKLTALSLKAVERRRIEKMLARAESMNLGSCRKYGCVYFRVGKSMEEGGKTVREAPEFVRVLEGPLRGQASRPHFELLGSLGVKVRHEGLVFCGKGKESLEFMHAVIE